MATKRRKLRKTLPKELPGLIKTAASTGDYTAVHAALEACEIDARGGLGNGTPLMMRECTPELARWIVARGTDVDATNTWGRTALHESCGARFNWALTPAVLIELGADVHRTATNGNTPLHNAVDGKHLDAVTLLLAHGAKINALSREGGGMTPLEYALRRMSSVDLVAMMRVARALLAAGATVSPRAREFVQEAAQNFEFHRAGFRADLVDETSAASRALCELFEVAPPAARRMHDGAAPIVATAATWQAQHAELWELLVPVKGSCATIQGEVIRIAGRVGDELHRNGGCNWDGGFRAMLEAFCTHVASHHALDAATIAECKAIAAHVRRDHALTRRLTELSVRWVAQNPTPVALPPPSYDR